MDIRTVCGDISQKQICLYGETDEIRKFLEKYSDKIAVECVVTDYKEDVIKQPYNKWNLPAIMLEQDKMNDEQLIVICSHDRFGVLVSRLTYMGKTEYKDYISCELVESLLYGKKLMVCMGTQLIEQITLILHNSRMVCEEYDIVYYSEEHLMEPYMNRLREYTHISRYCDVFIRSACEKERFRLKIIDKQIKNPNCKKITVADFGFGGYYPQTLNNRDHISDYMLRGYERQPISYETLVMSRCDDELKKLCQQNLPNEDIVKQLMNRDYFETTYVKQHFNNEVERFCKLEERTDIQLGNYIAEHKTERLCRNLNEWNEPVVSYVVQKLAEELSFNVDDVDEKRRIELLEEASGSEMMIYPSVEKALELKDDKKMYKVVTYSKSQYMTLEACLLFMTEYMKKAQELLEYTKMDCMLESK